MVLYIKSKDVTTAGSPIRKLRHNTNQPQEKADILNKFFASLFTQDDSPTREIENHPLPEMSPIEVHTEGCYTSS